MGSERKAPEPCSHRHLWRQRRFDRAQTHPGGYHLCKGKADAVRVRIIGFARRKKTDESWRVADARRTRQFFPHQAGGRKGWQEFFRQFVLIARATSPMRRLTKSSKNLLTRSAARRCGRSSVFIGTLPSQFGEVVEQIHRAGLLTRTVQPWQRHRRRETVGHDLASATR